MTQLYLCEKPSQARDIARVLGASVKGDGCLTGRGVVVTWCFGHLLEMAPPDAYGAQYKQWRLEDLPILPDQWQMLPKPAGAKQLKAVERAIKQASEVVIATDADREGETIAREILARCGWRGPVRRLWLSALDDASVRKALAKLLPGAKTEPLYHAGLARSRADWLVGMNLTRAYTVLGRAAGHTGVFSVGRVQTPTLRLVVDRDREIAGFQSVPYWELWATCAADAQGFKAKWQPPDGASDAEGRCNNEQTARALAQQLSGHPAVVRKIDTRTVTEKAPLPFDLGTLQQGASQRWGMGAQQVLDIAQALYEKHKATTYPRTDCPYLPASMHAEAPKVLRAMVQSDPAMQTLVDGADHTAKSRAWNDAKITAHHAIIPTTAPCDVSRMSADERKVYDAISRRYLAQFYPAHRYEATVMRLDIGDQAFVAKGRRIKAPGWRALFGGASATADDDTQALPTLSVGASCPVEALTVKACQTKPPAHFTEGTLIAAMKHAAKWVTDPRLKAMLKETAGLGTEATRAGIIKTLLDRGFIEKRKRYLIATETGSGLIDALPGPVKDPAMTALWEQALDDIAQRKGDHEDFLTRQADWVRQLVASACQGAPVAPVTAATAPQHPCPDCGKPLLRRKGRKGYFWGCSGYPDCTTTLADRRGKPVVASPPQPLGQCGCGGQTTETPKAWSCPQCQATVWKKTAGKALTSAQASALFRGETVRLKGLKSRQGKRFEASAVIRDGKVQLLFDQP